MYRRDTIVTLDSKRKLLPLITGFSPRRFQFLRRQMLLIAKRSNKRQQTATTDNKCGVLLSVIALCCCQMYRHDTHAGLTKLGACATFPTELSESLFSRPEVSNYPKWVNPLAA